MSILLLLALIMALTQTVLEDKYDLRFEMSDPNFLLIHVYLAYMVWAYLAAFQALQPPNSLGGQIQHQI